VGLFTNFFIMNIDVLPSGVPVCVRVGNDEVGFVGTVLCSATRKGEPVGYAPAIGWSDEDVSNFYERGEWLNY
jgi:hypothetical protein